MASKNGIEKKASWWTPASPPKIALRLIWITLESHINTNQNSSKRELQTDIVDSQKVDEKAQKEQIHYMLSNANVIVEKYTIGENCLSYEDGYLMIFKSIKHKR